MKKLTQRFNNYIELILSDIKLRKETKLAKKRLKRGTYATATNVGSGWDSELIYDDPHEVASSSIGASGATDKGGSVNNIGNYWDHRYSSCSPSAG